MYFDKRIKSIASNRGQPWDLMPWVKERKLPMMEVLLDKEGKLCNTEEEVFTTLHDTFNAARKQKTDLGRFYEEIVRKLKRVWGDFSEKEMVEALKGCVKNSTLGPDHVSWRLVKRFLKASGGFGNIIVKIANICFTIGHWPDHFKKSVSIIIPKPGKATYNKAKSFRPIVLLNTIGKLIKKMIANQLQFEGLECGGIHPCQTGSIKQKSIEDVAMALTHHV
jgi:hypothetical protein